MIYAVLILSISVTALCCYVNHMLSQEILAIEPETHYHITNYMLPQRKVMKKRKFREKRQKTRNVIDITPYTNNFQFP